MSDPVQEWIQDFDQIDLVHLQMVQNWIQLHPQLEHHPNHIEQLLNTKHVLFKKLKHLFLDQTTQETFLKRISELPFQFSSQENIDAQIQENQQIKVKIQKSKNEIKQQRQLLVDLSNRMVASYDALESGKETLKSNIEHLVKMEANLSELQAKDGPEQIQERESILGQKKARNDAHLAKILELKNKIKESQQKQEQLTSKKQQLSQNVSHLLEKQPIAEQMAKEAMLLSQSKDPQIEELGQWFSKMNPILMKQNDIKSLKMLSDTKIQIVYDFGNEYQVIYRLTPDPDTNKGRLVDCQMTPGDLDLRDVLEQAGQFLKMDECLAYVISQTRLRLACHCLRQQEMDKLPDVMYDPDALELMLHTSSGKAYVIKLDPSYPLCGTAGVQLLGVEPLEHPNQLQQLQSMIDQSQAKTLTELLSNLN
ncbi:hypothetical protein EDD86DRAFT_214148 [Gorgonomyces haynaldii]|nr:hypothetical protein EDD86DRAFT_214148 [Gorgonomyces haynaldii]